MKNALNKLVILLLVSILLLASCGDTPSISDYQNSQETESTTASDEKQNDLKNQKEISNKYLLLVNENYPLTSFTPNLAKIKSEYCFEEKELTFDADALSNLENLIKDARENGFTNLFVKEAYRTEQEQRDAYNQAVADFILAFPQKTSLEIANLVKTICDKPNESEYQTGYCVDFIYTVSTATVEDNETYIWLTQNCANYGFILRYPQDKEVETGKSFNFYHFRYVGISDANAMKNANLCLEEYLFSQP